jgi:hypothetical protein
LKPGLFGHARLQGSAPYDALLIPDTAVVADGPRRVAYVVDAEGMVQAKPLQTGPLTGGLRVVRSGLEPSDRVVIDGVQRARPGQPVTPVEGEVTRPAATTAPAPTVSAPPASTATAVGG